MFFKGLSDKISLIHHENITVPAGHVSFLGAIRSCSLIRHLTPVGSVPQRRLLRFMQPSAVPNFFQWQTSDFVFAFMFMLMVVGEQMKESQLEGGCIVANKRFCVLCSLT